MISFDRGSLDRILPAAPLAADWDDVIDRARVRRRRDRRRLAVLGAIAIVVVVGAASAIGSEPAFFLQRGFIGLPPEGATPSTPASGELVVHWSGFTATLPPQEGARDIVRAWVYADGRVIWDRRSHGNPVRIPEAANELNSGYLEQRLTPEGVELVRSAVAGLLDRSRALVRTVPADDDPSGPDGRVALVTPPGSDAFGFVDLPDGDRRLRLRWIDGDDGTAGWEGTLATPEQLSALLRVEALLTDPASVLPPSAWAVREVRAYVPSHYAVCIGTAPPVEASDLLSLLPAGAADLLRDKRRTSAEGDLIEAREAGRTVVIGRSVTHCFKVETEQARDVAEALSGLDPESGWRRFVLGYRVVEAVNNLGPTRIRFEPYFPHGKFAFSLPFG